MYVGILNTKWYVRESSYDIKFLHQLKKSLFGTFAIVYKAHVLHFLLIFPRLVILIFQMRQANSFNIIK